MRVIIVVMKDAGPDREEQREQPRYYEEEENRSAAQRARNATQRGKVALAIWDHPEWSNKTIIREPVPHRVRSPGPAPGLSVPG